MLKILFVIMSATLLTGTAALTNSAVAPDGSERSELSASQMANRADVRTAKMKVDLNLKTYQEKHWSGFASAMQNFSKKEGDRRTALHDELAQLQGKFDVLDQMRKSADALIERSYDRKKLADAAQPLYSSLDAEQKQRFSDSMIFGGHSASETY
jgi:hypothetical protein